MLAEKGITTRRSIFTTASQEQHVQNEFWAPLKRSQLALLPVTRRVLCAEAPCSSLLTRRPRQSQGEPLVRAAASLSQAAQTKAAEQAETLQHQP